jgi:phosphoribosyl 1,2-cyclic phosphodiesterase
MSLLRCDGMHVATLSSGSSGNCTLVTDGRSGVLVDCGLSTRQIQARMEALGLADVTIEAVFITHEHSDHVGAMGVLDRRLHKVQGAPVPFYLTEGTARAIPERLLASRLERVERGAEVRVGAWTAVAHPVPHDTQAPIAWTIERDGVRAGVITDLGSTPRHLDLVLAGLDIAVVEFNHDPEMLMDGSYPWGLKQRIRSRLGHLSNEDAAAFVARAVGTRLRHLILGHLSEENNTPELAQSAAEAALRQAGARAQLHVAEPAVPVGPLHVAAPASRAQLGLFSA